MSKIYLKYDPQNGITMPDGQIYKYVEEIATTYTNRGFCQEIAYGSEIILDVFRVYVQRGMIKHDDIFIVEDFNDPVEKHVTFNEKAQPKKFPSGFHCDVLAELISNR